MKPNMGLIDRTIRISVAIVIAIFYFTNVISGAVATDLFVIAGIFIVTGFISFCPIYHFLGISTKKKNIQSQQK